MSSPIITVENLSKSYIINHEGQERYTALRDVITNKAKKLFSLASTTTSASTSISSKEEFWALKDINFEISQGDRVGIIGSNGAGKSTLLKVLSRITEPTKGRVKINGRVASLLEVGTGFHPELTGRENIFLNGAILGMSRAEIKKHFDAIVDFAEVEKFLDTPVKRYSSGMYVRLAFAVAAHLEPEILIVDEVLAVGDAKFQKKCLGKLENLSDNDGRTVIFVSHYMPAIHKLCNTGIFLEHGIIKQMDSIDKVVSSYLDLNKLISEAFADLRLYNHRRGSGVIKFEKILLTDDLGNLSNKFSLGSNLTIYLHLRSTTKIKNFRIGVQLYEQDGTPILNMIDCDSSFAIEEINGIEVVSLILKDLRFYPDIYSIGLYLGSFDFSEIYDHIERCISFSIFNDGELTQRSLSRPAGLLFLTPNWKRESQL